MASYVRVTKRWRKEQIRAQRSLCLYCEEPLSVRPPTLEHVVPRSWGGPKRSRFNLVIICSACQQDKSKWECKSTSHIEGVPGLVKCAAFLEFIHQMGSKPKVLERYGHRNVMFTNISRVFQETLWHPSWRWLSPNKREVFYGAPLSRDYLEPLLQSRSKLEGR